MISSIRTKIEDAFSSLRNPYYREFVKLLFQYGDTARNKTYQVRFLNYLITVPDALSFIYQYKDIFVKESYKFTSASNSPVIIDCGANVGISCLYFKKLFPEATVTAFEADPRIAGILQDNLDKNMVKNVNVIPKAVWINNDGVEFGSDGADGGSVFNSTNKNIVSSIRLKDVLDSAGIIDMLKMDIEGAEIEVINDCSGSLKNVRYLFVEFHGWKGFPQRLDEVCQVMKSNGFRYFIEPLTKIEHPFSAKGKITYSDLQLNIYAENTDYAIK
jgi:FkbM family methyltransferase